MACGPRTSQDPERMDLVRENQLRGCPSISPQRIWKIWQPNWGCRPDRLKTFRFERKVLSCQFGKSRQFSKNLVRMEFSTWHKEARKAKFSHRGLRGDVPPLPRSTRG